MLKSSYLLSTIYGVLFFGVFVAFIFGWYQKKNETLVFSYPEGDIHFAGELLPRDLYNIERFDKEFLQVSNNLFQLYLYIKRYPVYVPYIKDLLKERDIPEDFVYMALAESALREEVVSSAGAAGVWQFMPETGKNYGLIVNDTIDERFDFEKSTLAALDYLTKLYDQFGNWTLVAAAYNRGENGLARDLESQGVDNYYDLYLNQETSRYIFRIMAIKYVMESYFERKEIIDRLIGGVYKKPETTTILVSSIDDLAEWSKRNGYKYKDIKNLNRWIVGESLPEGNWEITILER